MTKQVKTADQPDRSFRSALADELADIERRLQPDDYEYIDPCYGGYNAEGQDIIDGAIRDLHKLIKRLRRVIYKPKGGNHV